MVAKYLNFGGFVSPSTIDWPGKSVSVVFFRGCGMGCPYCHNKHICTGLDQRELKEIEDMILEASSLTSGVVFSGGECTEQMGALNRLTEVCKRHKIPVGIYTNGSNADVIDRLVQRDMVDFISLDIKTTWDRYQELIGEYKAVFVPSIKICLRDCTEAFKKGKLKEFRVAYTAYDTSIIEEVRDQIDPSVPFIVQDVRLPHSHC